MRESFFLAIDSFVAHLDTAGGLDLTHHAASHNQTGHIVHLGVLLIGVLIFLVLAPSRFQEDRSKKNHS